MAGDVNDFDFSETLRIVREGEAQPQPAPGRRQGQSLRGTELFNLWELLPRAERYSYIFEGNSQTLDHILVSPRLLKARPTFDAVHVNSEFFDQVSDHEPLVSRLRFDGDEDDEDDDDRGERGDEDDRRDRDDGDSDAREGGDTRDDRDDQRGDRSGGGGRGRGAEDEE